MICEISELMGLQIYTDDALMLGTVDNLVLDLERQEVYGIYVRNTNSLLVEGSKGVVVPFRWIKDVGDIVLLKYFPSYVKLSEVRSKVRKVRKVKKEEAEKHLLQDRIMPTVESIRSHIPKTIPKPHMPALPRPHIRKLKR